jgi:hypothetical protein
MADDLVTVGHYQFLHEAEAAQRYLDEGGIRSFLADAEMVNTDWFLGNALGYIKLNVASDDSAEATAALEQFRSQHRARTRGPDDAGTCLACGATFPPAARECPACGWSYDDGDDARVEADGSLPAKVSAFDVFQSLKKPVLALMLMPTVAMFGLLAIGLVAWLVSLFVR